MANLAPAVQYAHAPQNPPVSTFRRDAEDYVEVRIRVNGTTLWVLGLIVGTLDLATRLATFSYDVEYRSPAGLQMRQSFPPEDVRPRQNNSGRQ